MSWSDQSTTGSEGKNWVRLKADFVPVALSKEVNRLELFDSKEVIQWELYCLKEIFKQMHKEVHKETHNRPYSAHVFYQP
jgi:hypothetical protein